MIEKRTLARVLVGVDTSGPRDHGLAWGSHPGASQRCLRVGQVRGRNNILQVLLIELVKHLPRQGLRQRREGLPTPPSFASGQNVAKLPGIGSAPWQERRPGLHMRGDSRPQIDRDRGGDEH